MNPSEDHYTQTSLATERPVKISDRLHEEVSSVKKRAERAEFELSGLDDVLSPEEQGAVARRLQDIVDEAEAIELNDADVELVDLGEEARRETVAELVKSLREARLQELATHMERVYDEDEGAIDWRALVQHADRPVSWLIKYGELFTHVAPKQIWEELYRVKKPGLAREWVLQACKHELFDENELFVLVEAEVRADPRFARELSSHKFSEASIRRLVARAYDKRYALGVSVESCLGRFPERATLEARLLLCIKSLSSDAAPNRDWASEMRDVVRVGGWTIEETTEFFQKHKINIDIRWVFGTPIVEELGPVQEVPLRPFVPKTAEQVAMKKEWTTFVEKTRQVDGVVDAFCERVLRNDVTEDREIRSALRSASVTGAGEISGSTTAPLLLRLEGVPFPVVYKTPQREPNLVKDVAGPAEIKHFAENNMSYRLEEPVIEGVRQFEAFRREWLCSVINRVLNFNLVPPLVLREGPEGVGMMQKWETGFSGELEDWQWRVPEEKVIKLAMFHYAVWHCDGHKGNFNVRPDGELTAFDNGYSFSSEPSSTSGAFSSDAARLVAGKEIPLSLRRALRYIMSVPMTKPLLRETFSAAFTQVEEAEHHFNQLLHRIDLMAPKDENKVSRIPDSQKKLDG